MTLPQNAYELETFMQMVWLLVTPWALALAAIVLFVRFVAARRWAVRMSRATLLLIASYASLMVRLWARQHGHDWGGDSLPGGAPDAAWAAFYALSALYFMYALVLDWVLPFLFWLYRRARGDAYEETPRGNDNA